MQNRLMIALVLLGVSTIGCAHKPDSDRCIRIGREISNMLSAPDFLIATGQPYDERQVAIFEKIVEYGVDGVPFIIKRINDFRPLATQWLPLPNRRALQGQEPRRSGFESVVQYAPEKVVDALAAILNHLTHQSESNPIYNGAPDDSIRRDSIVFWQNYLKDRFYAENPGACRISW